jgi:hypothetical protein
MRSVDPYQLRFRSYSRSQLGYLAAVAVEVQASQDVLELRLLELVQ